ncbi:EamA family transporter [Pseudanabaena sp. FACHB-1998]|uniref:DMT family transporter n=1 Tax=Pseudanabaena sp. FACHB-1998 TaxID=2692858 RepID=UPI001681414D|nr:DMT family transporter [Pseudanabaena sp. FACHB-1998]MBD2178258.1 EamA family transporter [Pseudanabaena sp. FACHB-1998]
MESNNIRSNSNYEQTLAGVTKDLSDLRANILGKLSREILILQAQKNALTDDIQRLQSQRKELEVLTVAQQGMNQQEIQRQQWIEQLAQAITYHLKNDVIVTNSQVLNDHSQNFEQLMLNLDSAIRTTFQSLQRDVDTYQRDLDDQMQRMYTQRQQGELMLSALVERIDEYLRRPSGDRYGGAGGNPPSTNFTGTSNFTGAIGSNSTVPAKPNGNGNYSQIQIPTFNSAQFRQYDQNDTRPYVEEPTAPFESSEPTTNVAPPAKRLNDWWFGFILVLGASVVLSLQNILVRVIFSSSNIFGLFQFGGLIKASVPNSFMLLLLRMLFATPIMWIVAKTIFRVDVFRDFQQLMMPNRRLLMWRVAFSALLQFCSFAFIYIALGILNPGLAVTLFFIFPTVTVLMAWLLFGDRPSKDRWMVIGVIYVGIMLTYNVFGVNKPDTWGVIAAMLSGISFAGYIITSQACFKQLNPVSFTSINFAIILLLCIGTMPFTLSSISLNGSLVFMCFLIALTTLGGYLLTSFGTKLMGAAQASIVSASGPVFTTFLAFTILGNKLDFIQLFGVFLVTGGVGMLSLQNMYKRPAK